MLQGLFAPSAVPSKHKLFFGNSVSPDEVFVKRIHYEYLFALSLTVVNLFQILDVNIHLAHFAESLCFNKTDLFSVRQQLSVPSESVLLNSFLVSDNGVHYDGVQPD